MVLGKHSFDVSKYNFYDFLVIFKHNFSRDGKVNYLKNFCISRLKMKVVLWLPKLIIININSAATSSEN